MKAIVGLFAATAFSSVALGQGRAVINNRVLPDVNARFVLPDDPANVSSIGFPDWTVSFFGGPAETPASELQPLKPPSSTFRGAPGAAAAGYFNPVSAVVPNVPAGGEASILIRVRGPNGCTQDFGPFRAGPLAEDDRYSRSAATRMGMAPLIVTCSTPPAPLELDQKIVGLLTKEATLVIVSEVVEPNPVNSRYGMLSSPDYPIKIKAVNVLWGQCEVGRVIRLRLGRGLPFQFNEHDRHILFLKPHPQQGKVPTGPLMGWEWKVASDLFGVQPVSESLKKLVREIP